MMYYLRWPPFWPPLSEDFTQLVEFLARDVVSLQGNSIWVLWLQYQGIIIIFWFCAFIYLSKILILRELLRIPLTKCKLVSSFQTNFKLLNYHNIVRKNALILRRVYSNLFEFIGKLLHISTRYSRLHPHILAYRTCSLSTSSCSVIGTFFSL